MATSRPRLRTKTGCIQCRRRRKKCCEQRPTCAQCGRIGLNCSFDISGALTPDCDTWPDADLLDSKSRPCVIVFRYKTTTVRINPMLGESREICALLQFYSSEDYLDACLPDIASVVLQFLPAVADNTMALAAVTAILALFMASDWIEKSQIPLRLSQQAVRQLSTALAHCPPDQASDEILLTARLLYLFQLHSEPVAIQACSHLKAVGIILQHRLKGMQPETLLSTSTLESYLYHVIVTSTINPEVVPPDLTPTAMVEYFVALSCRQCCLVTDLTLLGISAPLLLELFNLSWLRREILLDSPNAILRHPTCPSQPELCSKRSGIPIESSFLNILYTHASSLFRSLLLDQVTASDKLLASRKAYVSHRLELEEALRFVFSIPAPSHVVTWPLLIIGLASEATDLREEIRECFKRLVENSRLKSAASSLEVMEAAWDTHIGLSALLCSGPKTMLVF